MIQDKAIETFKVQIEQCRNSTWQGKLTADGYTVRFRSEIELLLAIDKLLSSSSKLPFSQETGKVLRNQTKMDGTL